MRRISAGGAVPGCGAQNAPGRWLLLNRLLLWIAHRNKSVREIRTNAKVTVA
jgi:hypothetical protein